MFDLNRLAKDCNASAHDKGFWDTDPKTALFLSKLALIGSEVGELVEAYRGDPTKPCDKGIVVKVAGSEPYDLTAEAEEMADIVIRVADLAAERGVNLEAAIAAKHAFNQTRGFRFGGKKA